MLDFQRQTNNLGVSGGWRLDLTLLGIYIYNISQYISALFYDKQTEPGPYGIPGAQLACMPQLINLAPPKTEVAIVW